MDTTDYSSQEMSGLYVTQQHVKDFEILGNF